MGKQRGMDVKRFIFVSSVLILLVLSNVSAHMVLNVKHKFADQKPSVSAMKEHDSRRHQRLLYDINLPLEGNGLLNSTGLYFTQLGIGTPSKPYYVQVDTGSDVLWVNCVGCKKCPTTSSLINLGVKLQLYDPNASSTSQDVTCQQKFCTVANINNPNSCTTANSPCTYSLAYGDGSATNGYYVSDVVQYNQVTGDLTASPANTSLAFGCAVARSGNLASSNGALDGILGMGPSNTSMVSQLAAAGKVSNTFAHCLAGASGDGIFVIGGVAEPVKTTPLVPNLELYNVNMESVDVGGTVLQIPASTFANQETIIDSGTTLAYLTVAIYVPLMNAITSQYPNLSNQSSCFLYTGSVDAGFPNVTFNFQNSLSLVVYPHDYMIYDQGQWCILWQDSSSLAGGAGSLNILGDLVLSNKLVVYDLENQTIGWTEYNCSSSIALQTGSAGIISSGWSLDVERWYITFLLLAVVLVVNFN